MQPQLCSNVTEASINNSERKTNKQKKIDNHPHADYTDGQMNVINDHSPSFLRASCFQPMMSATVVLAVGARVPATWDNTKHQLSQCTTAFAALKTTSRYASPVCSSTPLPRMLASLPNA